MPSSTVPIAIVGLPSSGKTTFLAALWHSVHTGELPTRLTFGSLAGGDFTYLNEITKQWQRAKEQERTQLSGMQSVIMNLKDAGGRSARVAFPDVPGEEYSRMWEEREVAEDLGQTLSSGNIMLLLNGNKIRAPAWVTEQAALRRAVGDTPPDEEPRIWQARHAPTQVPLVDLLQLLGQPPLAAGPRRLAVIISAWDKAEGEGLQPAPFLAAKLPLLDQYLQSGRDKWDWRVYGVSAQGGDYDQSKPDAKETIEAATLRDLDVPSERIRLVFEGSESHDLTEPLEWLMK